MADETNVLDHLIGQIPDESLRDRLSHEVELLRGSRHFGLVFDRHLPESVRLVDHPVRKGIRVGLRDESSTETWIVLRFTDTTREVAVLSGDGGEVAVSRLVVVREFGEPVYPGLKSVERIPNGPSDAPWHVVINGENFHALQALKSTHREKVDLIYIDPPYNTGNDGWIYNDRYVDQADRAKSSKWLSFLERRLLIARDLLEPAGVIIVAIGDDEHHRLRMLMDQVFKPENFLADVVWHGGRQNDARYVSISTDYMLVYAKDESTLSASGIRWRELKPGAAKAREAAELILAEHAGDSDSATIAYRKWLKKVPKIEMSEGVRRFDRVEPVTGRLYNDDKDLSAPEERPNRSKRPLIHPVTKKPTPVPSRGWALSDAEMDRRVAAGLVVFGTDENKIPRGKAYLDESDTQVPGNVFERDRNQATRQLAAMLGDKRFPFPKDHEVLMRWFRIAAPRDAVILDFFGGSGTTAEAVMRLNAEDGGSRQSILVTNNEVGAKDAKRLRKAGHHPGDEEWEKQGVFEYVCRPRISTAVKGIRPDGSTYSESLPANVEMFDLTYLDPGMVRRGREFPATAALMWLEGGACGHRIETVPDTGWVMADTYGILFEVDALAAFSTAVVDAVTGGQTLRVLFIITDSPAEYREAAERLPAGVETVQLYEDYLTNYTINTAGGVR